MTSQQESETLRDDLSQIFDQFLLPAGREQGASRVLVAQTPVSKLDLPGEMRLLRREKSKTKLVELPYPYLCFVFRGEADIRLDDAVLTCPAGHAIWIPRGVFLSDGSAPHWERDSPETASCDIFWMLLRPFGAECHLCRTRGRKHSGGGFGERALISNRRLLPLGEMLIDEMTRRAPGHEEIAAAHWRALLLLTGRQLQSDALPHRATPAAENVSSTKSGEPAEVVERAKRYIEENLGRPLNLEEIARAAFVSRAHLARLFPENCDMTVWQYVTQRRLEEAKSLLLETDISIFNIARLIGFPHASYFSTRFSQLYGCTPTEFRHAKKNKDDI